jgi:hypothetical protein
MNSILIAAVYVTTTLLVTLFVGLIASDPKFPAGVWRAIKDRFKERYRIQEITQDGFTRYEVQSKNPFFGDSHTLYSYLQYQEAEYALEKVLQKERKRRQKKTSRTLKEEIV